MGQVFRKAYPLLNLTRMDGAVPEEGVAVAGPCCTPLDSFGNNIPLAAPEVGDLIGVFYSGAYGYSASNLGFLSHPSPAEVLLLDGRPSCSAPAAAGGRAERPEGLALAGRFSSKLRKGPTGEAAPGSRRGLSDLSWLAQRAFGSIRTPAPGRFRRPPLLAPGGWGFFLPLSS
jgi:hypothetical protein